MLLFKLIYIYIFKLISSIFLFLIGWSSVNKQYLDILNKHDQCVIVFSHTSYWDFYLLILYLLKYPETLSYIRTLVKPQPFEYAGWLLRKLGAIPSTKLEDKKGGAVERIINELTKNNKFAFLISPKGTIIKSEWRTGYYVIATKTKAKLLVAGLDYEKKCVIVSDSISYESSEEDVRLFLQNKLSNIVPLYPESEVTQIRTHNIDKRSVLDKWWIFSWSFVGLGSYYLYKLSQH